ncbi:hypothetical protein [Lysinibacillus boronitolerans]|uniref:Transposase n=1 Tax=Lysinibacillus boronitolerans JCM 21713 = 10a = NBRC 103108 TaxID=1294264 RepID=A0ABR4XXK6_9BACI|nr:hypothetical protein [Lysinibacillus boronitolerans]KGR84104.1 hypothetical protein CD31_14240 [Lysinibacillus boronitolerans JCM 21713 = 10a = NBRC 103108]
MLEYFKQVNRSARGWLFCMDRNAKVADKPLKVTDNLVNGRLLFLLEMYCYVKVEGEDNAGG